MATFLSLCESVASESGAIGNAPSAVTGQTGRQLKCVNWVRRAWELIQNAKADWKWMQARLSAAPLTISDMTYSASDLGIASRFAEWKGDRAGEFTYRPWTIYDNSIGQSDETALREISYEAWLTIYDRGVHDANRPSSYALGPDGTINFGPKPDKAYRVRGEYRKGLQTLAANGDIPELPERFHDIIVWRAIMLISDHDESDPAYVKAAAKYGEMMIELQRDQLPRINMRGAAPLA